MTVEMKRQWTCDNCGHTESHPAADATPKHWVGVKFNNRAPIGSMDHDGWSGDILCGTCWESIVDLLDNAAQDGTYPTSDAPDQGSERAATTAQGGTA